MKEIKLYVCGICGAQYKSKDECAECEKAHKTKIRLRAFRHVPYKSNRSGWPIEIFVLDENGNEGRYKLQ